MGFFLEITLKHKKSEESYLKRLLCDLELRKKLQLEWVKKTEAEIENVKILIEKEEQGEK